MKRLLQPKSLTIAMLVCGALCAASCTSSYTLEDQYRTSITRIATDRQYIRDQKGRYVFFHGVNVSGSTKFPYEQGTTFTYVGKPFPLAEADRHFQIIKDLGFNAIRLLVMWEGIEPHEKGRYDTEYLDYIEKIVAKANDYGIYVLMDMHQDIFSRHLFVLFNDKVQPKEPFDRAVLLPPLDSQGNPMWEAMNRVRGDGAPKWVVKLCLPDKNVDSPEWGRSWRLYPEYVSDPKNTTDMYPFTIWGVDGFLSVDISRCFATFFAGDKIYPSYKIGDQSIKDYLQEAYTNAWCEVAKRVKDYPNIIGYDVMNEPIGFYLIFTIYAILYQALEANGFRPLAYEAAEGLVDDYLNSIMVYMDPLKAAATYEFIKGYLVQSQHIPTTAEEFAAQGFPRPDLAPQAGYAPDVNAVLGLNIDFNRNYLQPFHERVGQAIQAIDPNAVIWVEQSLGLGDTGLMGFWISGMRRPEKVDQVIFAPHFYTDIYPFLGYNQPPREFTVEEIRYRSYKGGIRTAIEPATFSLGNIPTVMGEFGTYFNFNGIENAIASNYEVSANILDNYYEDYEDLFLSHILWCYSPENTKEDGEGWNKEDFSVLGPDRMPRAEKAYSRPYPRFLSGKPIGMHFYSDYHYYDPDPYVADPVREFELSFKTHETQEPTEIFVPPVQYPDGFYVYISDGYCHYDHANHVLYYHPTTTEPNTVHTVKMRPPYADYGDHDWNYFFKGTEVLTNIKP